MAQSVLVLLIIDKHLISTRRRPPILPISRHQIIALLLLLLLLLLNLFIILGLPGASASSSSGRIKTRTRLLPLQRT
ncbi:hypothetical protein CPC08DRAFT_717685 [Agrocybe pediades]|nr:hypothetical protein CPC08DRAFT_717685 [Agrocybe pediades]